MSSPIANLVRSGIEGFVNQEDSKEKKDAYIGLAASLITFIIALVILAFIGKLLWNGVIVDLFSFAKPARSYWQIIGLFIFVSLLYC